ncbi:glycine cleavage system protein GcvH [Halorussus salilacus]|uniref:glycine cleavage system protein GcvH n=1 Tax=Halorussus salilacus TaxID=2953750 RepID=UPI0020A1D70C|nr:glycine cleavage system protein GcvH [Halorussus salilacus]USZ67721.1 glycine cleavage system protein GcvH [Halorussus salilacus]
MSFDVPDDRKYLESHEWVEDGDGPVKIGISDFAQDELGDVVFVELPGEGDDLAAGEEFGVVESIKAVSDLYSPVSGEVVAVNDALESQPELVNDDPFGDGWMIEVEVSEENGDLLSADDYREQIE